MANCIFQVHLTHLPYDIPLMESPMSSTGFVGKIMSEKPSAMQYIKMSKLGDNPITLHIGSSIGIIKKIFADADPIKICKININKYM